MNKDIEQALLANLLLKTKIIMIVFAAIFLFQTVGIAVVYSNSQLGELPLQNVLVIPLFISLGILCEFRFRKYLFKCKSGQLEYNSLWNYAIVTLEVTLPTVLLYYGIEMTLNFAVEIPAFVLLNSPPLVVYFVFIILSSFYFDFKLSVYSGFLAMIEYSFISFVFLDSIELGMNISKGLFMMGCGVVAGVVSVRLKRSIESSLESKNALIHKLDEKVAERTVQIEEQKENLANQNLILNERNKEITDSINYAKRLQDAILPSFQEVDSHLDQNFIYFKPKDVVSGDFYWFEHLNGSSYFAAADCTGHGVPGAMVSVVCSNALNRALNEFNITAPSKILDKTRELVVETFAKSGDGVMDGMDIALCVFTNNKVIYSGANNPLWIVKNSSALTAAQKEEKGTIIVGDKAVVEYRPDKQPVGLYEGMKDFSETEIDLETGDVVYFFTDGFPDQFGGDKGKKFKYKPFKNLLLENHSKPMAEQRQLLDVIFEEWKGALEQVDDVCVIGVKI